MSHSRIFCLLRYKSFFSKAAKCLFHLFFELFIRLEHVINTEPLFIADSVRGLGISMAKKLKWSSHISNCVNKVAKHKETVGIPG